MFCFVAEIGEVDSGVAEADDELAIKKRCVTLQAGGDDDIYAVGIGNDVVTKVDIGVLAVATEVVSAFTFCRDEKIVREAATEEIAGGEVVVTTGGVAGALGTGWNGGGFGNIIFMVTEGGAAYECCDYSYENECFLHTQR